MGGSDANRKRSANVLTARSRGLIRTGPGAKLGGGRGRPPALDLPTAEARAAVPDRSIADRRTACVGGLAIAIATLVLMFATGSRMAIGWDEGYSLGREARVRLWFRAVRDPSGFARRWGPPFDPLIDLVQEDRTPPSPEQIDTRAELFHPEVLAWFWPFGREEPHGHPPFYALVGLVGDLLAPGWETLPRARLGTMIAFALTAGGLFAFAARRWGTWPGSLAAGAWTFQPRLFAEGHYAAYDGLLASLWVGSILAFAVAVEPRTGRRNPRWAWAIGFGVLAGWAADTKLTGWFLPLPFLAWTVLYRDRRAALTLLIGGAVGLATLLAFNPPWWDSPIGGVERFLRSNLTRAETRPIPVLFLGAVIETPIESLPWYNTLAWTALVTPVGFLGLALVGLVAAARRARSEPFGVLAAGHWAFLLILRALPHTPGHDGVRQFLPAFGVLAVVATVGAGDLMGRSRRWGRTLIGAALLEGAASVAIMMPVPLSYYGPIAGGLPGASTVLGMEPTYYWDGLTDDALAWLDAHTGPGEKVRFATYPTSWLYLGRSGRLRAECLPYRPGKTVWYVVQNRPGALSDRDKRLIEEGKPAFVVSKLGVPLVWIYPFAAFEAAAEGPR